MKHGTSVTDPKIVAGDGAGIDFRHSNAGLFGRGAYVAEDSQYSHDGYTYKDKDTGNCQMLLVRCAAGNIKDFGKCSSETKKLIKPPAGYDSVQGIVRDHYRALIFYDKTALYPAYLITYKP
jgi:hypothetical protein